MKEYAQEYMKYLQEQRPYLLKNYKYMEAFAKNIIDKCDDDTYFWLKNSRTDNLSYTELTPQKIVAIVYNTFRELSEEVAKEFADDIKKGKIKFIKDESIASKFTALRSAETRQLDDYEIKIGSSGTITDIFYLIHEYTHKLMEKVNVPFNRNKEQVDIYDEAAAIFSELLIAKRLATKYPYLREDISSVIATRINREIDTIIGMYETFTVIGKVQADVPKEEIKASCAKGNYTYESICEQIIKKEGANKGIHFIGLLAALNTLFTSTNNQADFTTVINEGKQGEFNFLESKVPSNPTEITKYVIILRKFLSGDSDKKTPTKAKTS